MMEHETSRDKKNHIGYFILSFVVVFGLSFFVLFFLEKEVRTAIIEELQQQEQRVVSLELDFLSREFAVVLSDLHYLHHAFGNELNDPDEIATISKNWSEFASQRRVYDQIRYIDVHGDEKIRINLGNEGGDIVPSGDLQNKKDRYYFTETVKLSEGSIYISPLDLNVEAGEIEIPYKPMIRLATPVYDESGALKGIIVLNYLADYTLSRFRDLAENSEGEIILLNSSGYSLSSMHPDQDWNFMFEEKKANTFEKEYSGEWASIKKNKTQFTTQNGLITAVPVVLSHVYNEDQPQSSDEKLILGDGNWFIVSVFERNKENSSYFNDDFGRLLLDVLKNNRYFFIFIGFVSGLVAFLVFINRKTYSKIKYYSEFDSLTKALNRRAGIARLNDLFPMDDRRHFLISLCFIDINGLKEVNDTLGHKSGDELITSVSSVIKAAIREHDFLVRLGGDEFLIVFNGIGTDIAENIWKRIVQNFDEINQNENRLYNISVSHGILDFDNMKKTQIDDLINAADEKMYLEKQIIKANLIIIKKPKKDQK